MKFKQFFLSFLVISTFSINFATFASENYFSTQYLEDIKDNKDKAIFASFTIAAYKLFKTINTPEFKQFIENPEYKKFHYFCLNNLPEISLSFLLISVRLVAIYFGTVYYYDPLDIKNSALHIKILNNLTDLIFMNLVLQKLLSKYFIFMTNNLKEAIVKADIIGIKAYSIWGAKINKLEDNTIPNLLESKKTEIAKLILNHPFFVLPQKDIDKYADLTLYNQLDDIMEILIKKFGFNINKIYKEGKTYLEYFFYKQNLKSVKFLVKHGAWKFSDGTHVLEHIDRIEEISLQLNKNLVKAISQRNLETIKLAISVGANPHTGAQSIYRFNINFLANDPNANEIFKELLKANGDVKIVDANSENHDLCSICQDVGDGELYPTKCKHYFHITCLNQWLNNPIGAGKCPTCKTEQ